MSRLKKGVWLWRDIPSEYCSPNSERSEIGYRHVLVDWLNRALSRTAADREAAERIGALIKGMNNSNAWWSKTKKAWIPRIRSTRPDGITEALKSFRQHAPWYRFRIDLLPGGDGFKWQLLVNCEEAPSGNGNNLYARWEDGVRNPELEAVEAVIHVALDGQLGTISRCEVASCRKWFLSKDDLRVRCCRDHDVDDLRKRTPERKAQVNAAAKRARERERDGDEKYWKRRKSEDHLDRPSSHRAEKP
jgi:hypothetical protein